MQEKDLAEKIVASHKFTDKFKLMAVDDLLELRGLDDSLVRGGKFLIYKLMIEEEAYEKRALAAMLAVRFTINLIPTDDYMLAMCIRRGSYTYDVGKVQRAMTAIETIQKLVFDIRFKLTALHTEHRIQWYDPLTDTISIQWADGGYSVYHYETTDWAKL